MWVRGGYEGLGVFFSWTFTMIECASFFPFPFVYGYRGRACHRYRTRPSCHLVSSSLPFLPTVGVFFPNSRCQSQRTSFSLDQWKEPAAPTCSTISALFISRLSYLFRGPRLLFTARGRLLHISSSSHPNFLDSPLGPPVQCVSAPSSTGKEPAVAVGPYRGKKFRDGSGRIHGMFVIRCRMMR